MKITFANGKSVNCVGVVGQQTQYQGTQRDSLTFLFDKSRSVSGLASLFTPEACTSIMLTDDDGNEYLHEHYTLRLAAGNGAKGLALGFGVTDDEAAQQVSYVRMAQTTLGERAIEKLREETDDLIVAVLEG